ELQAALAYSNVVFAGNVLLWFMNALASVIRGTGNMLVPAMVISAGVVVLVPLSPCLIFGVGPFPELGVAGAGLALVLFYAAGTAVLLWYILSGRNVARFRLTRLRWPLFRDILAVGAIAFAVSETLGLIAAFWPQAWLALFSPDPGVIETGSAYLRIVGPTYGFFGLGMALYFASQGAARLLWPLLTGFLRVIVAIGGGWLALRLTGSLNWLFAALAFGLIVYGVALTAAIISGAWFGRERSINARGKL